MDEKNGISQSGDQNVYLENRASVTVTGVTDVDGFRENGMLLSVESGGLEVQGADRHRTRLDPARREVRITGRISTVTYLDKREPKASVWKRMMK